MQIFKNWWKLIKIVENWWRLTKNWWTPLYNWSTHQKVANSLYQLRYMFDPLFISLRKLWFSSFHQVIIKCQWLLHANLFFPCISFALMQLPQSSCLLRLCLASPFIILRFALLRCWDWKSPLVHNPRTLESFFLFAARPSAGKAMMRKHWSWGLFWNFVRKGASELELRQERWKTGGHWWVARCFGWGLFSKCVFSHTARSGRFPTLRNTWSMHWCLLPGPCDNGSMGRGRALCQSRGLVACSRDPPSIALDVCDASFTHCRMSGESTTLAQRQIGRPLCQKHRKGFKICVICFCVRNGHLMCISNAASRQRQRRAACANTQAMKCAEAAPRDLAGNPSTLRWAACLLRGCRQSVILSWTMQWRLFVDSVALQ